LAGQVFMANGELEKAEDFLARAASAAPEDAGARMRLGAVRMAGGDAEHALADLEAAAAMDQDTVQADIALVMAHLRSGNFDKALEAQAQLERKQADNPLVYNLRGGLMLAGRDAKAAREAFEKALSIDPNYLAAIVNLSRLDLADQRPKEALERLKAAVDREPGKAEARLAYADFQRLTGASPAEVLSSLQEAEKALPASLPIKLALIQQYLRNRDVPTALSAAQAAVAANPRDAGALRALAQAQVASGEPRQAIGTLEKVVGLMPNSPAPLVQIAELQRSTQDLASADQTLRRALSIEPDSAEIQRRLADVMSARGDHAGALAIASSMQKKNPGAAAGYLVEADVQARRGEWTAAASAYRAAQERAPRGEVLVRLHAALLRLDRKDEAAKVIDDWLRAQPRDMVVRGYLAERALAEKQYPEAARVFGEMHDIAPQNPLVLNNLAWSANQVKDPKALEYAEQAHALAPDNAAILDTLGVIQIARGEAQKGFANLERAVELAPDAAQLRLNLARAYADAGRSTDARKQLDTLMPRLTEGSPLHAEATKLLKSL
ncbi:MAG: PEP-CTERM system TPR-repeat protein PrsT, partial [Thauera phenolivorans]|nr:PEP-CTERM system TPR-repeat protein PrsT [Thauera phenolivorans]